jgi:hypothetical protein
MTKVKVVNKLQENNLKIPYFWKGGLPPFYKGRLGFFLNLKYLKIFDEAKLRRFPEMNKEFKPN